ncbi:sensor histidine kinase [Paenibacillus contaminans]|uniref:histidine kinase n=1 Tax=Paenibacillus contaminans TaxID=450362 RepID=A0A329LVQ6_9BACL|nr:sensor histidine kinase [Paenibacillus contaminans]RAV11226.1 two-component sensor histidine kinase [Paenibacillus contaminans]
MKALPAWLYKQFTQHIQVRLTCYFLLILLPLVAISLFANIRSQQTLEKQIGDRTKGALTAAVEYVDLALQNVDALSTQIASDQNLIRLLNRVGTDLSPGAILEFSHLMREVTNISAINPILSHISILHAPSGMLVSSNFGGKQVENAQQFEWVRSTMEANGGNQLFLPTEEEAKKYANNDLNGLYSLNNLSFVRTMDVYNQQRQPNVVILTTNRETLVKLTSALLPSQKAQIYLYVGKRLVTSTSSDVLPPEWDDDNKDMLVKTSEATGEQLIMIRAKSRQSNWSVVMVQPMEELRQETEQLQIFTIIIIGISVLLAFWIAWIIYRNITSPLESLAHGMKQMRLGNLNVRLENNRKDQLGYLTGAFNQMAEDQLQLIQGHYEQELRMSKTELKFLQSQINPHFLYNTLDSIYWAAKDYDADEISEMVLNLSKFFRLSLSKGRESFTVSETIDHLHYYLRVQQIRFSEHFAVEYEVAEESRTVPVLKLLLQPIVENAILHGLEAMDRGGLLRIAARIEDDKLVLQVRDNGKGIPAERLDYIRGTLDKLKDSPLKLTPFGDGAAGGELFGLRNVAARMNMYYGDEAELRIESEEGDGTVATLLLPLDKCLEDTTGMA